MNLALVTRRHICTTDLAVATYNIRHALSDDVAFSDIRRLVDSGADVIGLQEMAFPHRRDAVRQRMLDCGSCAFDAFRPDGEGPAAVPVLSRSARYSRYRSDNRLVKVRYDITG